MQRSIPYNLNTLDGEQIRRESTLSAASRLKTFDAFSHKGTRGHAAIVAGSPGMMGACLLSTKAAVKSGAGKVTAFVPKEYFGLVHLAVPEAIVKHNAPEEEEEKDKPTKAFDAIGIGPGMGISNLTRQWIGELGRLEKQPCVIDADALNQIAQESDLLKVLPTDALLTPHPLEWERLFGKVKNDRERIEKTLELCSRYQINMILKGHFSCLVTRDGELHINGTGNAGMGKGGSGDLLTGLLTGLLAQGYTAKDAAIVGMYIHGLAGDLARERLGEEYMSASDTLAFFSDAFIFLRKSNPSPR
jgi:ADP-dependent NAD(P)H-hydrate dehydratase / NAD(P)H-hydrate epimerase